LAHRPIRVLFLCLHNTGRSLLAEAALNHLGHGRFAAFSAGSLTQSGDMPHPMALLAIEHAGLSTAGLRAKNWDEFSGDQAPHMDLVVTLCDVVNQEVCPVWPGHPATAHWSHSDPLVTETTADGQLAAFSHVLLNLHQQIEMLINLPDSKLDRLVLEQAAREVACT